MSSQQAAVQSAVTALGAGATAAQIADINYKINGAVGEANLQEDVYKPIIELLASNNHAPKLMRDIAVSAAKGDFNRTFQALTILVGMGVASPCQPEMHIKAVRKFCDALNMHVLQMGQSSSKVSALASPVTGTGVPMDRITQLFLLGTLRKSPDLAAFAWQVLQASNEVLMVDNKPLQGEEAHMTELKKRIAKSKIAFPILKSLQIA